MPFAKPAAPGGGIEFADHKGALLLVRPIEVEKDVKTKFGLSDAVRADVNVLDGPGEGASYVDALIFPLVLQQQLRKNIGDLVLGRLGQGEAKDGNNPPWILEDASPEDETKAEAWVKENTTPATTKAAPPF